MAGHHNAAENDLLRQGDTGLLFLELNSDGQLELGTAVVTSTYSWPLSQNWSLTDPLATATGASLNSASRPTTSAFERCRDCCSSTPLSKRVGP